MGIRDWPPLERPREKLLARGPQVLSDAELLAIFLRTGCAGKSAVDLARELLTTFSGLRPLLEASKGDFCRARGLGEAKYAQLQAVMEMARRHLREGLDREQSLTSSTAVRDYLRAQLRHQPREVFAVLLLDSQHRLIRYQPLFWGSIDSASVHPREIVSLVLAHNAAALILAHNHPSGVAEPSQADRRITQRIQQALALIDVEVLDHMLVADNQVLSFAERGLLL